MLFFIGGFIFVAWLLLLAFLLARTDLDPITKLMWVVVVIFVPFFGMLLYLALAPPVVRKDLDISNQLAGTPWEHDSGHQNRQPRS